MDKQFSFSTIAAACLLASITSVSFAQPAAPTASTETNTAAVPAQTGRPRIAFAETSHDFGRIICGQAIKVEFVFTNVGDATLEITDVKPHCGCTVAGTWDKKVEPGMTGKIPLSVDSGRFDGMIAKSAAVSCNDTNHATTELTIRGTVWKPVSVNPTVISFAYPAGQPTKESRIVIIKNNSDEPLTVSDVASASPAFQAELKTITPDKEFNVVISTVPESITDRVQSTVTFKTSSTNMPTATITTMAYPNPVPAQTAAPAPTTPAAPPRVVPVNAATAKLPAPPTPPPTPAHQ